ncbi:hypothetical protein GCM10011348_46100 [Marinobacterium nitratireducens]|uniref:NinB protein n=1 Tax=Marinobacterium nitratireducens TaxID=518897 RepID=A0A917ZS57_9GAMM|nr:recombination protein NinB [Marinobacterium nitratireducens]GGO89112.1 hypothetical protein GCM10011348_46100 [Marinobacterium nitratireducens]
MADIQIRIDGAEDLVPQMNRVWELVKKGLAGGTVIVTLGRQKRSLSQNAKMWPMLTDLSNQVEWYGEKLSPEDWKHVMTAGLVKQRAVPGIEGGFVVLGVSTSKMKKETFSQLIELMYAFGAEQGVKWSESAMRAYEQYREATNAA